MYKVVLIHKENYDVIGEIGSYDDINEATEEANDYNRKGDRHIGQAVVQATLDGNQQPNRQRGLRFKRKEQPQTQTFRRALQGRPPSPQRFSRPRPPIQYEEPEELSSEEESSSEEQVVSYQRNPSWHDRGSRPTTQKMFAFLIDDRTGKGIVLEHNSFLNNFLLAHPSYQIQSTGEIHDMIFKRNQYLNNRRR
jgi:hypothetical protein